jgi:hypothetical protein
MLQHIDKKKRSKIKLDAPITAQTVCGACNHLRKATDTCPNWQCPGCGKAYSKVDTQADNKPVSRSELRRKNREYLHRKRAAEKQSMLPAEAVEHPALTGIGIGILTFLKGVGSACVAANPLTQILGIVIVLGSIVYGLSQFWS